MIWLARRAKAGIGMLSFGRARNAEDWKVKAWLAMYGAFLLDETR